MKQNFANLSKSLQQFSNELQRRIGERDVLWKQQKVHVAQLDEQKEQLVLLEEARGIISKVLLIVHQEATSFVSEVVTQFLAHVFGGEYSFKLVGDVSYNKPALTPVILKGDIEVSPRDEVGGGVLDVVSLGMRLAAWAISAQRTPPILLLDEPGKFLDADRIVLFGEALRRIVEQLNLQVLLLTHEPALVAIADVSFLVEQKNGISSVKKI